MIGRLCNGAPAEADVPRPKAEQEAIDQYQQVTDLTDTLQKAGEIPWAEERKARSSEEKRHNEEEQQVERGEEAFVKESKKTTKTKKEATYVGPDEHRR